MSCCGCCCISRNPRKKRAVLHFLSLVSLPLCLYLLISSVLTDTPWFRLTLKQTPGSNTTMFFASPLAFSVPGLGSMSLLGTPKLQLFLDHHGADPQQFDDVVSLRAESYPTLNVSQRHLKHSNSFPAQVTRLPHSTPSPSPPTKTEKTFLVSVWSLQTVTVIIPHLNISHKLPIANIPSDPILAVALSIGGVYRAALEAASANSLIQSVTLWSLPFIVLGALWALICCVVDCLVDLCFRGRNATSSQLSASDQALREPLYPQQRKSRLRRDPLLLSGILSLLGAACLGLGFSIWMTRSVQSSQVILQAIARTLGRRAIDWIGQHTYFELELGSIFYGLAFGLLLSLSLLNMFTDISNEPLERLNDVEHRSFQRVDQPPHAMQGEQLQYVPPPLPV